MNNPVFATVLREQLGVKSNTIELDENWNDVLQMVDAWKKTSLTVFTKAATNKSYLHKLCQGQILRES